MVPSSFNYIEYSKLGLVIEKILLMIPVRKMIEICQIS